MRRQQAQGLIGSRVQVWTAANGVYVGVLEQVYGSPWRGRVRITGVISPAQHFERGGLCRRGFRPGEVLDAGGSSITPTQEHGVDYLQSLRQEVVRAHVMAAGAVNGRNAWVGPMVIQALQAAERAEQRRLAGDGWHWVGDGGLAPSPPLRPRDGGS